MNHKTKVFIFAVAEKSYGTYFFVDFTEKGNFVEIVLNNVTTGKKNHVYTFMTEEEYKNFLEFVKKEVISHSMANYINYSVFYSLTKDKSIFANLHNTVSMIEACV